MNRTGSGGSRKAAAPTAMVAAAASSGRRARRRRAPALAGVAGAIRSAPDALSRRLPGGRRTGLAGLGHRRGPSLLRMARHAGTAVSAVGFAVDLLSQINELSDANHRRGRGGPAPADEEMTSEPTDEERT